MKSTLRFLAIGLFITLCCVFVVLPVAAQTTGTLAGQVKDEKDAVVPNATVTVRNVTSNESRTTQTDDEGRYRFTNMAVGEYELTIESSGFAKHVQSGIELVLNQNAVVNVVVKPSGVQATVNVVENASMLNTTTAEVGTRFDDRRYPNCL